MGNGPRMATFLDWGERDWLKKEEKRKLHKHNSSHISHFLSFSEWSVEDGLIGLFIFKEWKEKKKKLSFQGIAGDEKRAEKALCRPQGLDLCFWEPCEVRKKERDSSLAPRRTASTDWQLKNAMICYVCRRHCRENLKSITMQSEPWIKC